MGLYLCVRDESDEIDGADLGMYSAFGAFRQFVSTTLESGKTGSRFPVLMLHSDCDGEWSVKECMALQDELREIGEALIALPPVSNAGKWQDEVMKARGRTAKNASDSFIDSSGIPLVVCLLDLVGIALEYDRPILFQ